MIFAIAIESGAVLLKLIDFAWRAGLCQLEAYSSDKITAKSVARFAKNEYPCA